jgi:hypothetical protein
MDFGVVLELISGVAIWAGSALRFYAMRRDRWVPPPPSLRVGEVMIVASFVFILAGLVGEHWRDALIAVVFLPMALVSTYSLGLQRGAEQSRATERTSA